MSTERITMADGSEIMVGGIPYRVEDGILYVGMVADGGYGYVPMGKVKGDTTPTANTTKGE